MLLSRDCCFVSSEVSLIINGVATGVTHGAAICNNVIYANSARTPATHNRCYQRTRWIPPPNMPPMSELSMASAESNSNVARERFLSSSSIGKYYWSTVSCCDLPKLWIHCIRQSHHPRPRRCSQHSGDEGCLSLYLKSKLRSGLRVLAA